MYTPMLCAYILMTPVLSVLPIIARSNVFCAIFNRFQSYKKDGIVVGYSMAVCSGTVNYTAGRIGKGKGFPHILVAVLRGGGQWGSEAHCILDKEYEIRSPFLSVCCLILPF